MAVLVFKSLWRVVETNFFSLMWWELSSNHENGGVRRRAELLKIPFMHFSGPYTSEGYMAAVKNFDFNFIALSGWLKFVFGLDSKTTFNIHPGLLPSFGGPDMYGHYVHEAVLRAYREGRTTHTGISMHFIKDTPESAEAKKEYDKGPVFFRFPVAIHPDDTVNLITNRVNVAEHYWQPIITDLVVRGEISWDGKDPKSLSVPHGYQYLPL